MPANVLQKNQTYPELGYRIDGRGIAYDLETNRPLSRQDVDARIAQAEDADPASDDFAARDRKRGGVAGLYDRNKDYINPAMELILGAVGTPALSAAYGAAVGGLDQEGKGGISFDAKDAALGGVKGYGLGKVGDFGGDLLGNAWETGTRVAEGNGLMTGVKEGAKTLLPGGGSGGVMGAAKGVYDKINTNTGLTAADWLKGVSGAVGAGLDYKTNQGEAEERKNQFARTQGQSELKDAAGAQRLLNTAPMADNAQYLLQSRMGAAPTTFAPRDYTRGPMTQATMAAPVTGGPQDALAAGRTAAASYTPGAGGVDTSVLELLKKRMLANSGTRA